MSDEKQALEFVSAEERQAIQTARINLYNRFQDLLNGHTPIVALQAIGDALAVAIVQASGADRANAHEILDRLLPGIRMEIDNNLDRVAEMIIMDAKAKAAGNA